MKSVANEIMGVFEKHKDGECTYDKALEDISVIINKYADTRPIVGYVKSGMVREVLQAVWKSRVINPKETYMFDCKIHQNQMQEAERILKSL